MRRNRLLGFTVIILTFVSCKKPDYFVYEFLVFRDNHVRMWPDTLPSKTKNEIENGNFIVSNPEGDTVANGKFSKGFKIGQWLYHPTDSQVVHIHWEKYKNHDGSVLINYPLGWKTLGVNERPFQARYPLKPNENERGKYFIAISYEIDSIGMDLETYNAQYQLKMFNTEKIKEYAFYKFEMRSGNFFYFARYVLERNDEELLILSFLGESGSKIYDITYSSLNDEYEKKHIIFFDMLRSLMLDSKRFFSPFDPVRRFTPMKKHTAGDKQDVTV